MKFTTRSLESLKPRAERYEAWEDNGKGFGLRVAPSGKKSFIYMYRFEGRPRRMTLGQFPKVSLAQAHQLHAQARAKLERGIDPGAESLNRKRAAASAATVQELVDQYMEKHAKPRKRSWREDERILHKEVLRDAGWGKRKAKDITRRDVIELLDSIVERGAPIAANRTFGVIRKMFNFAISRDIVSVSPCTAIVAPSAENRRDRVLSEQEIGLLWKGLDTAPVSAQTRLGIRLIIATAQRNGEVVGARKEEFDLKQGWWTIPGERAKNGLPHRVPLNDTALEVIQELLQLNNEEREDNPYLFPSPHQSGPILADALSRAVHRSITGKNPHIPIAHFTPHDLRRTAASHMASLGVSRLVIGKLLNHVERGVTAIYDRHSYDSEKRQAMDAWDRKLQGIIHGKKGNVITLTA